MQDCAAENTIAALRRFNRFYTGLIGALDDRFLGCDVTLPEARLLYEIASQEPATASTIQAALGMDAGYVSRIVARFEKRGWIIRARGADARARVIRLTEAGRSAFASVDGRQRGAVADLVGGLDSGQQADLTEALARVRLLLRPESTPGFAIRPFRTGDMGLIAARQSKLYAESHGWGRGLEIVEGESTTNFLRGFKPRDGLCPPRPVDPHGAESRPAHLCPPRLHLHRNRDPHHLRHAGRGGNLAAGPARTGVGTGPRGVSGANPAPLTLPRSCRHSSRAKRPPRRGRPATGRARPG